MKAYANIGLGIPEFLLPKPGVDLSKWAVIACDQYTSEPDYWRKVAELVGDAPSTLKLVYPELYLQEKGREQRIQRIRASMFQYLEQGLFEEHEGLLYVERTVGTKIRKGILACLDLEHYDFHQGAKSLIRTTEGTILERLPPRVAIREGAPLELPHIMVLIDDPQNTVMGPLAENKQQLIKLYDFELMMGSGHLTGFKVPRAAWEERILKSLFALADPGAFTYAHGVPAGTPVLLYAMGDGNHSLATAKAVWEKTKERTADRNAIMHSRLRYALVELVNLHDPALLFEPIHRILFGLASGRDPFQELRTFCQSRCRFSRLESFTALKQAVEAQESAEAQENNTHRIGLVTCDGFTLAEIDPSASTLPVAVLQSFLDGWMNARSARALDYVHGTEVLLRLSREKGNLGFYLPAMPKKDLFKTVILEGALPRKTFSLGEAREKRFYLEARKLIP